MSFTEIPLSSCTLKSAALELNFDAERGQILLNNHSIGMALLKIEEPILFRPWLDGAPVDAVLSSVASGEGVMEFRYRSALVEDWTVTISLAAGEEDAFDVACSFRTCGETQINRLDFFPANTGLNFIDVVNFRNRHHTAQTLPELLLGGKGCETNTYSTDWQFAPHPTALLLRNNETALFWGAMDLPKAFGQYFSAAHYKLKDWYLDFGSSPHGLKLATGEKFVAPTFRLFLRTTPAIHAVYEEFGEMLVRGGRIPDPSLKQRESWWREPLYCTWIDQCFGSKAEVPEDLEEQAKMAASNNAKTFLTEALVRRAVAEIKAQGLPIRAILLDDGWQKVRGQWEPDPQNFPDLRGLVDDLHADGFKVAVWWNWAEILPGAEVDPAHCMAGGKPNKHGALVRDYSNPLTQEEYLRPLFRQMFSSEPGCYNLDGVKTDFLADKVHADMPLFDDSWRGEENYFYHVSQLFYAEMKKHKPDAIHIGCAGNYWLADLTDINRTYDVSSGNWYDHETRALMLKATTPGCPVAYDFHNYLEGMAEWFASARSQDASVQIGNVLWYRRDRFSEPQKTDEVYREMLKQGLTNL